MVIRYSAKRGRNPVTHVLKAAVVGLVEVVLVEGRLLLVQQLGHVGAGIGAPGSAGRKEGHVLEFFSGGQ